MKLYIPEIGNVLILEKDCTFQLYNEYRNDTMIHYFGIIFPDSKHWMSRRDSLSETITLPKDTKLKVDRIYIRKGNKEFSSISFLFNPGQKVLKFKQNRFWAKLEDVNNIEFIKEI